MNISAYTILWCAVSSIFGQYLLHETDDCLRQAMSEKGLFCLAVSHKSLKSAHPCPSGYLANSADLANFCS